MEEFLKELGITKEPSSIKPDQIIIDIDDSNEYGKIYSKLDKSELVDEDQESSQITFDTSSIQFESDDYLITLLANFETDEYKLTIKEN